MVKKTIRILLVFYCFILIAAAIAGYYKYGRGIGYYLMIGLPLLAIAIGLTTIPIRKHWWIIPAIVQCGIFAYVWKSSGTDVSGYIPYAIVYLAISGLTGYAFHDLRE